MLLARVAASSRGALRSVSLEPAAPPAALLRKLTSVPSAFSASLAEQSTETSDISSNFGETPISTLLNHKGSDSWTYCTTHDNVLKAIRKMSRENIGSLIVLDATRAGKAGDDKACAIRGIFTERDYLNKIVLEDRNSRETSIVDVMTPKELMMMIEPSMSVMRAMEMMVDNNIRHLPVLENDKLVGMVSIRDVITTLVTEHKKSMDEVSSYINGTY